MSAQLQTITDAPTADESAFKLAQRQALAICESSLVPEAYRGKANLANVMIAMELAHRIGSSPLLVMQSLYIVQGKPSWSSSFLIATVNACGRFEPIRFEVKGDDPHAKDYAVRAYAKDKASDTVCHGAWITWKMVDAEGWAKKSGSKWITMPQQMFFYRAAGFWARVYAPEISLGMLTQEEAVDVSLQQPDRHGRTATQPEAIGELGAMLAGRRIAVDQPPPGMDPRTGEVPASAIGKHRDAMIAAATVDALSEAYEATNAPDATWTDDQRDELAAVYTERLAKLEA